MSKPPSIVVTMPLALALGGCGSMVPLGGAYFPAWLLSAVCGVAATAMARAFLVSVGVDALLQPRLLVYPALAVFFTLTTYLIFFP